MTIDDEYILNKYWKGKQCSYSNLERSNKVLLCEKYWISHRFVDSKDPLEVIYRLKNHIVVRPVCPICGNPVKWDRYLKYSEYCSKQCVNKNPFLIAKRKKTLISKYGVDCPSKIKNSSQKAKQTKLERYGDENYNNITKSKRTRLEKYGEENYVNVGKIKQTKLERYGDENYNNCMKTKQTKLERYGTENYVNVDKIKQTKLERYGDENYNNREQAQLTCLLKYGVLHPLQNKTVLDKVSSTCFDKYGVRYAIQLDSCKENAIKSSMKKYGYPYPFLNPEFRKYAAAMVTEESVLKRICTSKSRFGTANFNNRTKAKETCVDRYGVDSYSKTNEWKQHMSLLMSSKEVQDKRNNTFHEHKTFSASKPEENLFDYIKLKFPSAKRQYRDNERYPFNCDFYIPEFDLFLELNGTWTHNNHPFDPSSIKDQITLEQWKSKQTKYYDNAIKTWTERDVKKRNIAKENKLNFKEVWSLEEGIKFIDKLKNSLDNFSIFKT